MQKLQQKTFFLAFYEKGKFMVSKMVISVCYIRRVKEIMTIENIDVGLDFELVILKVSVVLTTV